MLNIAILYVVIENAMVPKRFEAIGSKLFKVHSITHIGTAEMLSGKVMVLTRSLEEAASSFQNPTTKSSDIIFLRDMIARTAEVITNETIYYKNQKSRYLTVATSQSTVGNYSYIIIEYDFVKASKKEIVFEMLGKNR